MSVPYYPGITTTPYLGLKLIGMDEVVAEDFVLVDENAASQAAIVTGLGCLLLEDATDEDTTLFSSVTNMKTITADGQYNGSNSLVSTVNGLLLAYSKGTNHTDTVSLGYKLSVDEGVTWGSETQITPYYAGPIAWNNHTMPGGNLVSSGAVIGVGVTGYSYSTDDGATWSSPISFEVPFVTLGFKVGSTAYLSGYKTSGVGSGTGAFFYSSIDDGVTWSRVSEIRKVGEPALTETGICHLGGTRVMAISRDGAVDTNTYVHFSDDLGVTWGDVIDYTDQVGVLALPQLMNLGNVLLLLARQTDSIQLAMYLSYDSGVTFSSKIVLDTYTTSAINGGYCWPLVLDESTILVSYYASSTYAGKPDIKSLVLNFSGGDIVNNAV